jgi:hypothetical protein
MSEAAYSGMGMILLCMTSSQGSNTGTHHVGFFKIFEINPGIKLL